VLHNGREPLRAMLAGVTRPAAYADHRKAELDTTSEEKLIMPGTGKDPKSYATINEVRYAPDGNHLIIKATAVDSSVVEFTVQIVGWPKPVG
jgi:hypothetical protein